MICVEMGGDLHNDNSNNNQLQSKDGENKRTYTGFMVADLQNLAPGGLDSARSHVVKPS